MLNECVFSVPIRYIATLLEPYTSSQWLSAYRPAERSSCNIALSLRLATLTEASLSVYNLIHFPRRTELSAPTQIFPTHIEPYLWI